MGTDKFNLNWHTQAKIRSNNFCTFELDVMKLCFRDFVLVIHLLFVVGFNLNLCPLEFCNLKLNYLLNTWLE